MQFGEELYRIYRIYECGRCRVARMEPEPMPEDKAKKRLMGFCKASGKEIPIYNDPQYSLIETPGECEDFNKGKPRKKKLGKKEERIGSRRK